MPGAAVSTPWQVGDPWPYNLGNPGATAPDPNVPPPAPPPGNVPGGPGASILISEARLKALLRFAPKRLRVEVLTEIGRAP